MFEVSIIRIASDVSSIFKYWPLEDNAGLVDATADRRALQVMRDMGLLQYYSDESCTLQSCAVLSGVTVSAPKLVIDLFPDRELSVYDLLRRPTHEPKLQQGC